MNTDARIVSKQHISSVLKEGQTSDRTIEVKKQLQNSPNKLHNVVYAWIDESGLNSMARIRIVGEIVGYIIKAIIVAILFGPSRTIILVLFVSIFLNNTMGTSLPIGITAGMAGIVHLIFAGIDKINGNRGHGHGGAHGTQSHGHH